MRIAAVVTGDREVVATLADFRGRFTQRVVRVMTAMGVRLANYTKAGKLSGQVLRNRTGQGRASVTSRTTAQGGTVTTEVGIFAGPTVPYMRAHEFGVDKAVDVKGHVRKIAKARRTQLKRLSKRAAARGDTFAADAYAESAAGASYVRPHSRHMRLRARHWLSSALTDMHDGIVGTLEGLATDGAST